MRKSKSPVRRGGPTIVEAVPNGYSSSRWTLLALGLIALTAIAAYSNSFSGVFILDDIPQIVDNLHIRRLWPIRPVLFPPISHSNMVGGRPVVNFTLAVNYAFGGAKPWGYHAANLAIHILAAWLLWGIVRRTLAAPATLLATTIALIWAVHPLQTESITYVIQRSEALMGLFFLLTLYCFIRGAESNRPIYWNIVAAAACALGMATKEVMVTAPAIVLLYDRTYLAGSFREAWRRRRGLYSVLAATWLIVPALLLSTGFYGGTTGFAVKGFTWQSYLLTESAVLAYYLRLAFWPVGLCLDYGWLPARSLSEVFVPASLIAGLLALTVWALTRRPAWGFLGAWFFVILAPTSSVVPIQDAAFEHRMYLPLAAVATCAVLGVFFLGRQLVDRKMLSLPTARFVGVSLTLAVVVLFAILTFSRNVDYSNVVLIYESTVAAAPHNKRAQGNLGAVLIEHGRYAEAVEPCRKAIYENIVPDQTNKMFLLGFAKAYANLGVALLGSGQSDEAIPYLQQALELSGGSEPTMLDTMAAAYAKSGRFAEAVQTAEKALQLALQQNNRALAESIQAKLQHYESGTPMPATAPSAPK
jgi:protein O-mannosyl-transferase